MTNQSIRYFLFAALVFVGMLLFNSWQQDYGQKTAKNVASHTPHGKEIPDISADVPASKEISQDLPKVNSEEGVKVIPLERQVKVKTDVLDLTIDTLGGDIIRLSLPKFTDEREPSRQGYTLFDDTAKHYYIAQSGLAGENGPDIRGVGRAKYTMLKPVYQLGEEDDVLTVDLTTRTATGVDIIKRFVFQRSSYLIDIDYLIKNNGKSDYKANFYARLKRKPEATSGGGFFGIQTFTGAAVYTPETPYKKFSFKDIEQKPFEQEVKGGWAAMVEHYFIGAFIPSKNDVNNYQTNSLEGGTYGVGFVSPITVVKPSEEIKVGARLYAGPEVTDVLEKLSPGLELTADYGILWPICQPIFWLLKKLFVLTGNWGWSIILTTLIIKLLFYKLSASSYRSMGVMRKLQPKMQALKERHGEDKQKYSQAMMELYKKEKVNPFGGCLPILIQIPVFIALYYVLLGSVELREAPFALWITDLSAKDPYYVLPILMGLSMLVQQKLSPAPPDPVQAKVMMMMPIFFTALFLSFPSGLVLYWFVNNMLSIGQQWLIMRNLERASTHHGGK